VAVKVVRNLPVGHGDGAWVLQQTGVGSPMVCTCSFNFSTAPTSTQMLDLQDAFGDTLMPLIGADYTLVNFHVFYRLDASNDQVFDANGPAVVGTGSVATGITSPQVAMLIRKTTQFAGRRNVGRMFVPGILETDCTSTGSVTPARLSVWQAAAGTLYSRIAVYQPEIVHTKSYDDETEQPPTNIPLPTAVTAFVVDNYVATQRRRLHR